jgi:predicted acylesterase/phospholipase RssA
MIKSIVRAIRGDPPPAPTPKRINLALQGGGAFGAFSWGVLDHLLDDGRLEIEGITGASAGAVNAVMLADGLARGGREEARKRLADFWRPPALAAVCPTCSARPSIACSLLCRSKIRRWGSGSRRYRNICRPTISIRSTSIR